MRKFIRESSLSLGFGLLFLAALVGQAFSGWAHYNNEQSASGLGRIDLGEYLLSANFAVDISENWQSEYLQFLVYIVGTVWLLQRGSPESKELHKGGLESEQEHKLGRYALPSSPSWAKGGRFKMTVYSWSLVLVMLAIFLGSWFAQLVGGWASYNEMRLERLQDTLTLGQYFGNAEFWSRTFQNWQSEFLAVGSMAVLSIYLRQRGSPESKPVGEPHESTGVEG
jgi:hypothetical protein